VAEFKRDLRCASCGREYLLTGASPVTASETETLAQLRCTCGEWMGAFVPGGANVERLIVAIKGANRPALDQPLKVELKLGGRKGRKGKKSSAA
jgi:hypothetical protein